jgi:hypothetical protein
MMEFLKENYQMICLLVGIIGVLVGILSVAVEIRKRKKISSK